MLLVHVGKGSKDPTPPNPPPPPPPLLRARIDCLQAASDVTTALQDLMCPQQCRREASDVSTAVQVRSI